MFYSGTKNQKHEHGVGFIVKNSMVNSVKKIEPISDKNCYLQISGKILDVVFINCYAPTESAENNTKDDFYDSLERTFDKLPRNCITIIVGDLNVEVCREEVFQRTAEKESLHLESNSNRIRLISFAASKDL
ncbi:craniofacial development protein 2-like [Acyrthosiphon pisum]|uniref:Craniofacial development protein 2-like n=1 Tax=Acyrthosiphon pisum TaxID=7029 RepID=A0A8R1WXV8_ACYPI|nr:craniofacial development protein 2-like [Acyrthosiphon pisum]|eukprot:XP_008178175.1 PREDICTED: craniofacial development protein 2-like [Acyrthosiphon pisum]